ncbi:SHIPPO-1-RELATED [Carpediemonas membranifera]|uniref:SHIPPO-1-RELATED n=1 Tax=Carpediemonas membranifera TaxID=201153 RepID=A0A8J6B331_9EUKA|nr:SHIPPO-1-RELATED [Carpediemonas membranifera]|eukprot:KAG9393244.1 SHIPPO-1-RELATED [Carpediemonas membranifera]
MDDYATDSPGPGAYSLVPKPDTPSYTMASRQAQRNRSGQTPGPGQYVYDTNSVQKNTPAFSMSGKPAFDAGKAGSSPGPGAYGVAGSSVGENSPAFSITGRRNYENHEVLPGPGHYGSDEISLPGGPQPTMKGRNFPNKDVQTASPGPAAYSRRDGGVGTGPKYSMSRRHRVRTNEQSNPGPGAYLVPTTIGRSGPSYSLSGRTSRKVGIMRD